jgi:hypothetical protein
MTTKVVAPEGVTDTRFALLVHHDGSTDRLSAEEMGGAYGVLWFEWAGNGASSAYVRIVDIGVFYVYIEQPMSRLLIQRERYVSQLQEDVLALKRMLYVIHQLPDGSHEVRQAERPAP